MERRQKPPHPAHKRVDPSTSSVWYPLEWLLLENCTFVHFLYASYLYVTGVVLVAFIQVIHKITVMVAGTVEVLLLVLLVHH